MFENKIVVVTGASRGIGKTIAIEFSRQGAIVVCIATSSKNCYKVEQQILKSGGTVKSIGCHVEIREEVRHAFKIIEDEYGKIDVLVNNAGVSKPMATMQMDDANWNSQMDINCKSIFLCSQAAAISMKTKKRGGTIINIGSILGRNAFPATLAYCASKAAVDQMTKVMAIEWAKYKIRVNCIAPGYVQTELIESLIKEKKIQIDDLKKRTPQRQLGTEKDVANAVIFAASKNSSFMTGETIVVDGGWTAFGYY